MRTRFEQIGYRLAAGGQPALGRRLWNEVKALGALLLTWRSRARERHHLAALSHHMRRDLGLSDADVFRESQKPFWQP